MQFCCASGTDQKKILLSSEAWQYGLSLSLEKVLFSSGSICSACLLLPSVFTCNKCAQITRVQAGKTKGDAEKKHLEGQRGNIYDNA